MLHCKHDLSLSLSQSRVCGERSKVRPLYSTARFGRTVTENRARERRGSWWLEPCARVSNGQGTQTQSQSCSKTISSWTHSLCPQACSGRSVARASQLLYLDSARRFIDDSIRIACTWPPLSSHAVFCLRRRKTTAGTATSSDK